MKLGIILCCIACAGQSIPPQLSGLSTSTADLSPMVLPPQPAAGGSYVDTYHPNGSGYVSLQRLPYHTSCSIRAWQSNLFVGAFLPLSYGGRYYSVPYSAGVFVPQAFAKTTNAPSAAGTNVLYFASTNHTNYIGGIVPGVAFTVTGGANIPANTTVVSYTATSVTLSANLTGSGIASGASITFTTFPTQAPYQEISYDEACNQVKLFPSYSTRQAFNSDGSRFMVISGSQTGAAEFYRTNPLSHERTIINAALTSTNGSETWSHTDPDVMYLFNSVSGPKFQQLNVTSGVFTTLHDFTSDCGAGYQVVQNGGAGNPSMDDRYWAGFCKAGSGQQYEKILVYDRVLDSIVAQRTVASICGGAAPIDTITMSPLGTYVVVAWQVTGFEDTWHSCQGNELFDRATLQSLGMVFSIDGHNDVGLDVNGYEVAVGGPYGHYATNEPVSKGYTMYATKLSEVRQPPYTMATSYVRRYLIPCSAFYAQATSDPYTGCSSAQGYPPSYHISGRASESAASRGWFLMSTFGMPAYPPGEMPGWGKSENIAFRIDTNVAAPRSANVHADFRRVSRNVAHRNNDNTQRGLASWTYLYEPHATVNRDFTKLIFASSWFVDQGQVLTYLVDLSKAPPSGISGRVMISGKAAVH